MSREASTSSGEAPVFPPILMLILSQAYVHGLHSVTRFERREKIYELFLECFWWQINRQTIVASSLATSESERAF
jgi:hypothetical protein